MGDYSGTENANERMASVLGPSGIVEQMVAAMRSNDPDLVLEMYTDDCFVSDPAMGETGKQGLRRAVEYFFSAFHVEEFEVDEVVFQIPTLILRCKSKGIHQGEYLGVQPTGKSFETWSIMWLVLTEGKIQSDTSIWDAGELRRLEAVAADQ